MKVAVVGATGIVGETLLRVLAERELPIEELGAFASEARKEAVRFEGRPIDVRVASDAALREYDVVFFASSEETSARYIPALLEHGIVVIDTSAAFRLASGVPLIVPEVNAACFAPGDRLFPVGNCTAIILCVALAPVLATAGLRRVQVATYQAVSGAGRLALEEFDGGQGPFVGNVVPQIGAFNDDGSTGEEQKVRDETRKILGLPHLSLSALTVRVPVRSAHSEAVFFETERETTVETLAEAFERARGVVYHSQGVVTPRDVEGTDFVHVARLRPSASSGQTPSDSFQMWVVGDQLRKGAATNGVQILELLIAGGLFVPA